MVLVGRGNSGDAPRPAGEQVGCHSKVPAGKDRWHSTLRAKSCRRSSLLYTYTRAVRDCCDEPQARRVAYDQAQQLCSSDAAGSMSPRIAAAPPPPQSQQQQQPVTQPPRGAASMAPLDQEQMFGAAASPWHTGAAVDYLDSAAGGPQHMPQVLHHGSGSGAGVWAREYSAASIARVPDELPSGLYGGGGSSGGLLGRLGSGTGGANGNGILPAPLANGGGVSQSQPHPHLQMRTVCLQPGRPGSFDLDFSATGAAAAVAAARVAHHFSANTAGATATATINSDFTCGQSTLSSNSSTCVARLAQLVLSSENAQPPSQLQLQLHHSQQQQHFLAAGAGMGMGAGGAAAEWTVAPRSDLGGGGGAGLLRYSNIQYSSPVRTGPHAAEQQHVVPALAAPGGAGRTCLSGGRVGGGEVTAESLRAPFRTNSEAAALSLGLGRRTGFGGAGGGAAAEAALRGKGGGWSAPQEELGFGGDGGSGSVSAPATMVGYCVAPDAAFSRVRQMQQLRTHNFITSALAAPSAVPAQNGQEAPKGHEATGAGSGRLGDGAGAAAQTHTAPHGGGAVRRQVEAKSGEAAERQAGDGCASEGAAEVDAACGPGNDPWDRRGSRGGPDSPGGHAEVKQSAQEQDLTAVRQRQPLGLAENAGREPLCATAGAAAMHHSMAFGRAGSGDGGGGGFPDGSIPGLTARPWQASAGLAAPTAGLGCPLRDVRRGAQVLMGAAAAAGMNSLQQPTVTDAVVVMGLGDDDILSCLGGLGAVDAGSRRIMLGYGRRQQQQQGT